MKVVNGSLSALWSVLGIGALGIVEANESILAILILIKYKRFNVSVLGEELSDLNVGHAERDVLHIDVVDELSHLTSVLGLELDGDALLSVFSG